MIHRFARVLGVGDDPEVVHETVGLGLAASGSGLGNSCVRLGCEVGGCGLGFVEEAHGAPNVVGVGPPKRHVSHETPSPAALYAG
ncbi:MAG: hypothetical protein WBG57_03465 [Ornithinimicrobium sp.]